MRFIFSIFQVVFFILIIDLYVFKAINIVCKKYHNKTIRIIFNIFYWGISVFFIILFICVRLNHKEVRDYHTLTFFFNIIGIFLLFYVSKIVIIIFHLIEDIICLIRRIFIKNKNRIRIISKIGFIISIIPFIFIFYGMFYGRYNYKINYNEIKYDNLPQNFNGFKIVQISDFHLGTLNGNNKQLQKIVSIINSLKPDVIIFTGDLVNNFADEVKGTESIISKLKAKYGKYSVLGNHDYGDYTKWRSPVDKENNLKQLILWHKILGFKLLLNRADSINLNGQKIAILGVENWGLPPFHKYGNIFEALDDAKNIPFKILLSHDPSHWSKEVKDQTDIALTLSGHTHGFQFGYKFGNKQWSPIQYKYPQWSGLYKDNNQYLYVNTGIGVIGFPGRIGMPPEITVIVLKSK